MNENTPPDTNIGRPITASDSDRGDTRTYSLVDPDPNTDDEPEDLFDIDEEDRTAKDQRGPESRGLSGLCGYVATAQLKLNAEYSVTVAATDQKGGERTLLR